MSALDMLFELLETFPVVLATVGVVLLFRVTGRQRAEQRELIRELEVARVQGERRRTEARTFIDGLGQAKRSSRAGA
jgi:cytochrome c-type biogenesis protein CcmH/NrfF